MNKPHNTDDGGIDEKKLVDEILRKMLSTPPQTKKSKKESKKSNK